MIKDLTIEVFDAPSAFIEELVEELLLRSEKMKIEELKVEYIIPGNFNEIPTFRPHFF